MELQEDTQMAIGYPRPKSTKIFETEAGKRLETKPRRNVEAKLYSGRKHPFSHDDGLVSKEQTARERVIQRNSDPEDKHDNAKGAQYDNFTSGWVRSKGEDSMANRPAPFDYGPSHGIPSPTRGGKCEATGKDMHKSPFSAAHKTYGGDGRTSGSRPSPKDIDNLYRKG
jgi:hypothetical protein